MKVRLILLGMVAGLVLPLAAANAGAIFDPGLKQAGASADLERGAAPTAENFGRNEYENKGDQGDKDHQGDYDHKGDYDHHGDDHQGDKSPCKPK